MNDELDNKLCKKYPRIFRDRNASMQVTAMCWGLCVGSGWYNIINNACSLIQHHINWSRKQRAETIKYNRALKRALNGDLGGLEYRYTYNGVLSDWGIKNVQSDIESAVFKVVPDACPQVVASQVKEKFGSLRFYYDGGDEHISGIVRMAEAMSGSTCEDCGNVGQRISGGWIRVLCNTCNTEEST